MRKTLAKHGNSYALVIEKPIMDLLNITPDTPLDVKTDGRSLLISPNTTAIGEPLQEILDDMHRKFEKTFRRLAE